MALIACKTCNAQIAQEAKTCPQCGATSSAAYAGVRLGALFYLALLGGLFYMFWQMMTPG